MSLYVKYRKVVPFFRKALIAKADAHIPGHQMTYKGKVVYLHNLGKHVDTAAVFVENSFNYGPGAGALFTQYCITAENIRYFHFLAGKRVAFGTQAGVFLFAVQMIVISGPVKNALHYCKIQLLGVYHFQKIFRVVNGNVQCPPAGGQIIGHPVFYHIFAYGFGGPDFQRGVGFLGKFLFYAVFVVHHMPKRYDDVFNVRVITRNGKLTSAEQQAVAAAAEKFGSGEVTMTTRLTLEIQGVQYDRLEELFRFLEQSGLETGGTGSKVRPVVSCKGTTCQYGLIDTFDPSEKLHNLFYKGYHEVALPHKFKIAVGGCPNNCVKPDLNDLGFVGLIVPNAVRRLASVDMRFDIGLCAVCGAFITVLSDLVARVLFAPAELPAGIIMAVLGSPFFLYILIKRRLSYDTIQ